MEENVFAGNAVKRRVNFQYGSYLETGATALGMSTDPMLDYLGIRLDAKKMDTI